LLFRNRAIAFSTGTTLPGAWKATRGRTKHERERIVKMVIRIGDIRMVMVLRDVFEGRLKDAQRVLFGADGEDAQNRIGLGEFHHDIVLFFEKVVELEAIDIEMVEADDEFAFVVIKEPWAKKCSCLHR
jgi:hypothetical protein